MSNRKNFGRLFEEQVDAIFEMFTLEQAAVMMRAMITYQTTGEETDFGAIKELNLDEREIKYMNGYFKSQIASMSKSVALINRSRENGEKGGRPKNADTASQNEPARETISLDAKVSQIEEKRPLIGIDDIQARTQSQTGSENVNLSDEDLENLHEVFDEVVTNGYKNYVSKEVADYNLKHKVGTTNSFKTGIALGLSEEQTEQLLKEYIEVNCR